MKFSLSILTTGCMLTLSLRAAEVKAWNFNTVGNTENWSVFQHMTGLAVSNAISGSESVLTSADITDVDPLVRYNNGGTTASLWLSPGATGWDSIALRIRLLNKNPGEVGVTSKPWPDPANGTLVYLNQGLANGLNTLGIDVAHGWTITPQTDNWIVASHDISSLGANTIKSVRVDPIAQDTIGNFEIDYIRLLARDPDPEIVATEVVGQSLKLVVATEKPLSDLMVVERGSLSTGNWSLVTYSTNGMNDFLCTDLSAAVPENGNHSVYVPLVHGADFYSIDATPRSNWFGVVATSDGSITTHDLASGDFIVGISDIGGGYINRLVLPGLGDVMGFHADRYGRGGQSSIRGSMHGGKYNPTQAGFSDQAGTICRVCTAQDGSALVVAPRPCCLFRGDGAFDFTEWENLANDFYTELGGSNDWDTIDESLLEGKQATEVTSEFDYYCTYENWLGTTRSSFGGTNAITIPAVRHYYEYRYVREPGHCILQHNLGPLYDPVAGEITDISVANPAGIHAATSNELGVITWSMSIRIDRPIWTATYLGMVNGSMIGDLAMLPRTDSLTLREFQRSTALATRALAYNLPNQTAVAVPLFILADSSDIDQGGALGLYYPDSIVNEKCVIGVDRASGAVVYEDDRRLHTELRDTPARTADMSWNGFRGNILGVLNPLRLPATQYESFRGEFFLLYGSPREIFENAQRIHPF